MYFVHEYNNNVCVNAVDFCFENQLFYENKLPLMFIDVTNISVVTIFTCINKLFWNQISLKIFWWLILGVKAKEKMF